jgi:hypothetical protein
MAAVACFIGATFSWLRGPGHSEVFHSTSDDIEEGLSGAGEIAMSDVGAGSSGVYLDSDESQNQPPDKTDVTVAP